jgi:renalase
VYLKPRGRWTPLPKPHPEGRGARGASRPGGLVFLALTGQDRRVDDATIVIGAGVAGLALARELARHGRRAVVLERARGVGGRCATRRIDGQPVDHGVAFLHGRGARFHGELNAVQDAVLLEGWPRVRTGDGLPCQPAAFDPDEFRVAVAEGVSRFPKHLARELDVRLETNVAALRFHPPGDAAGGWEAVTESGGSLRAGTLALALPPLQALRLLATLEPRPVAVADILPLLELPRTLPCLTVIAGYPDAAPRPDWDASYPHDSRAIQVLLHDSSKRHGRARLTLVIQARAAYSRAQLETPPDHWARALLAEAARFHGDWLAHPERVDAHAWRGARVDHGSELAAPVMVKLDETTRLGLAGDAFHTAAGVEGAYYSGVELARRFIETGS